MFEVHLTHILRKKKSLHGLLVLTQKHQLISEISDSVHGENKVFYQRMRTVNSFCLIFIKYMI